MLNDIDLYRSFVSADVPEEAWLIGNLSIRGKRLRLIGLASYIRIRAAAFVYPDFRKNAHSASSRSTAQTHFLDSDVKADDCICSISVGRPE